MEKTIEYEYVSPNVEVIGINIGRAILTGSLGAGNESYEEEDI